MSLSRRYQIAVPVVVFACAVGATLGYRVAKPTGDSAPRVEPQFETLNKDRLGRLANANIAVLEQRIQRAKKIREGRAAAAAWLGAVVTGAPGTRSVTAALPKSGAAAGTGRSAIRWLNELGAESATFAPRSVQAVGEESVQRVLVRGTVAVTVTQATTRGRTFRRQIDLQLVPRGARWQVTRVVLEEGDEGLASYADPVILTGPGVQVVAAADRLAFAQAVLQEAKVGLPGLAKRYAGLNGPERVGIYVVETGGHVLKLLGQKLEDPGIRPTGWTYENGDVVLLWDELDELSPLQRRATVRHELVHVVTQPLIGRAPTLVLEGLATQEESELVSALSTLKLDLRELRTAFREKTLGYQDLLDTDKPGFGGDKERSRLGYLAGYATIGFIEDEYGRPKLDRLLTMLRSDTAMDTALDRSLGLTPVALERKVRVWTAHEVAD